MTCAHPARLHCPIDYFYFTIICLSVVAALTFLLHHTHPSRGHLVSWALLPIILIPGWFFYKFEEEQERARLRESIMGLALTYAYELTEMGHAEMVAPRPPLTSFTQPDDPDYLAMIERQKQWLQLLNKKDGVNNETAGLNKMVADIYTFRWHPDGNQLIVDSETDYRLGVSNVREILGFFVDPIVALSDWKEVHLPKRVTDDNLRGAR